MSVHTHYVIGASLGTGIDPTAIAVLEQQMLKSSKWRAETEALHLRHLERITDANYPGIVKRISTLLKSEEIEKGEGCKAPGLVLDISGSGHAVLDPFKRADLKPIILTIGGTTLEEKVIFNDRRVPKAELVGALRVLYETERLKMASELDLVPTLMTELRQFQMRPPPLNPNDPESWRERPDDDLIFAVAAAAWWANQYVPKPEAVRESEYKKRSQRHARGTWMSNY
jgi:hypothetical protein